MITRHKWLPQYQAQSVKFDRNIWEIMDHRQERERDSIPTLNRPPRQKLQVYWKKTTILRTITLIWVISWKATFTEVKKELTTIKWNPLKTMMLTLRFPRKINIATLWSRKLHWKLEIGGAKLTILLKSEQHHTLPALTEWIQHFYSTNSKLIRIMAFITLSENMQIQILSVTKRVPFPRTVLLEVTFLTDSPDKEVEVDQWLNKPLNPQKKISNLSQVWSQDKADRWILREARGILLALGNSAKTNPMEMSMKEVWTIYKLLFPLMTILQIMCPRVRKTWTDSTKLLITY